MNAILSGSAGVAILVDGKNLFSIDIDQLDEIVPRRPRELPYLLGDAQDQQIVEDVDRETVKRLLDEAWRGTEALQLALILMDGELSDETRALAATELEEALGTRSTTDQVEAVLWSRPLPPVASIEGALALCARAGATRAGKMFAQVHALQATIHQVWEAFEALPEPLFGKDAGDRARARAGLVREGVFWQLVAAWEDSKNAGPELQLHPGVKAARNHPTIVLAWLELLGQARLAQRDVLAPAAARPTLGDPPRPVAYDGLTDEVLMTRFQAGELAAFAPLVTRHKTRIYNLVLRFARSPSDVEDLVQDVFVTIHRQAAHFRHQSRFSTWAYAIARRVCLDYLRRVSPAQHLSTGDARGDTVPRNVESTLLSSNVASVGERVALIQRYAREESDVHADATLLVDDARGAPTR